MIFIINKMEFQKVIKNINLYADLINKDRINIMEVCGTHTNSIAKYGINTVISNKVNLLSGPGCPVCVTSKEYIDAAVELALKGITVVTFGDLIKVKGTYKSLAMEKSEGRDIRVIYSVSEVFKIAKEMSKSEVVFLGVGFETTAPLIGYLVEKAYEKNISNLSFLTSIKVMPPILEKILSSKNKNIHGIICPGNVAVITGSNSFKFIYKKYSIPSVVCGFEAIEILGGIYFLIKEIYKKSLDSPSKGLENLYRGFVSPFGNQYAKNTIKKIFKVEDGFWRGIGKVKASALVIRDEYSSFDAVSKYNLQGYFKKNIDSREGEKKDNCRCQDVLLGNINPFQCKLFRNKCTPIDPCGPCMVSSEGACRAYYKYGYKDLKN
ncbi:hydrogenase formation protein HypD [Haloimpatiens sp. FM7315]|uniref:hydrogenase formation protein HypD n=1 Tax=Haloimpatiens sp. FM7315 TaxID=3298609 RepID=UPI0039777F05